MVVTLGAVLYAPALHAEPRDDTSLLRQIWEHDPEVLALRGASEVLAAGKVRAKARPNPELDLTWGTLPVGNRNPVSQPWENVPNYGLAVRQPLEPGRPKARTKLVRLQADAQLAEARAVAVARWFAVQSARAEMALAVVRGAALQDAEAASEAAYALLTKRVGRGDASNLDLLRADVERSRLRALRQSAERDLKEAQARCGEALSAECPLFANVDEASRWLDTATAWRPASAPAERADVAAARADGEVATGLLAVSAVERKPTLSWQLGYLYDRFTVSGNQRHSLNVGLSFGLPVWSRGAAERAEAQATRDRALRQETAIRNQSALAIRLHLQAAEAATTRLAALDAAVTQAARVVKELHVAHQRGGVSMSDVLQAQQGWLTLLVERVELRRDAVTAALAAREAAGDVPGWQAATEADAHAGRADKAADGRKKSDDDDDDDDD